MFARRSPPHKNPAPTRGHIMAVEVHPVPALLPMKGKSGGYLISNYSILQAPTPTILAQASSFS